MHVVDVFVSEHPYVALAAMVVLALLVVVAVGFAMDKFIGYAEGEPAARRPHPFSELNPGHCDRCWREANRRRAAAIEAQAARPRATVTEFSHGRWPRI